MAKKYEDNESKQKQINYKNYKNLERDEVAALLNEITYVDQMKLKIPILKFAIKKRQLLLSSLLFCYFYFLQTYDNDKTLFLVLQSFLPYNVALILILYLFSNDKYEDILN